MTRTARALVAAGVLGALLAGSGCATVAPASALPHRDGVVRIVAAENFWGSLAAQLGGVHAEVTAIISNPDADPHDYEPTSADATRIHDAQLTVVNGVGYDTWASKVTAANPSAGRIDLVVGSLVGTPADGNPHRWYDPADVRIVAARITAGLVRLDPADAGYFQRQHDTVVRDDLSGYFGLTDEIRARFAGTPVGASESIFAPLAAATGLDLVTPASFLTAISEGGEPTAADKRTIDAQIRERRIRVYVYNRQNATPDVQAQVRAAKKAGIPVTEITETLTPVGATFQAWQSAQLNALLSALTRAGAGR
jgi:zinc/manganese transport system substrate-binding protein